MANDQDLNKEQSPPEQTDSPSAATTPTQPGGKQAINLGGSFYQTAFEASSLAIFVHQIENGMPGAFIDMNEAACKLLGYPREELIGMLPRQIDADPEKIPPEYQEFLTVTRIPQLERDVLTKDGRRLCVLIDVQRVEHDGRQVAISFVNDVTDRIRTEQAMVREKEFTDRIIDTVPDTIFVFDPTSGTPIRWNRAMRELSGFTDQEIAGRKAPDDWYSPEDLQKAGAAVPNILDSGFSSLEMALKTKNGNTIPTEYTAASTTNLDGDVQYIIAVGRDITERKRAAQELVANEQRLRAIYNNALAGIVTSDMQGQILDINQRWVEMIGYTSAELKNMRIVDFTHPDDVQSSKENIHQLFSGAVEQFSMVKRYIRKDGSEFWGEVHVSPIYDQDGRITRTIALVTDITVRRLIEEELERERNLFITGPIVVFKWSTAEGFPMEYVSPNVEETFGHHPADFTSGRLTMDNLIHPDDYERIFSEIGEFSQTDNAHLEQEYRIRDKQGNWRWLHDMTIPIRDDTGQITHFLGYAIDITGRKQVEEDLKQAQNLFITGPTVVFKWQAAPGWPVEYVSPNVTEQFGYSVDELVSGDLLFSEIVHPDDLTRVGEEVAGFTESGVVHFEQEYRICDKQGSWRWVYDLTVVIRTDAGEITHYHGYVIDITERKMSEQALIDSEKRYELVLAGADLGTWDWDIQTGKITLNERWMRMLGYEFAELEHEYETWKKLIHPEDRVEAVNTLKQHLSGTSEAYEMEFRMLHKSGSWIWVLTRGKVTAWDEGGKPTRMAGTHLDITQRKNLEEQLRQTQKLEAIGTLAGGIAHDFNNILLSILGNAELAEDLLPVSNPVNEHLHEINIASRRAAELIKQLLAFSRPSKQPRGPVSIKQILDEVLSIIRATLPASIQVECEVPDIEQYTKADPTELHQVLLNLCTNAGQSMLEFGGKITIHLDEVNIGADTTGTPVDLRDGTYARLKITDTGTGMTPEVMERIFEPFFTTREIGKGSGMGLAVVHGLIRSLSGAIDVASQTGRGTTFTVYLPMVPAPVPSKPAEPSMPLEGDEHILLVDDEPQLVRIFSRMLKKLGYRVTAYTDSRLTLEVFKQTPYDFDLVITDQTMPELSGAELAQEITRLRPDIPVVLITGYSETMPEERAAEMGVTEYVMKPLDFNTLGATIRRVLDNSKD